MSVDDFGNEMEDAARSALLETQAIVGCPVHKDVIIRVGDEDAERHAYALATSRINRSGSAWKREDLVLAIEEDLSMVADGECPECTRLRDA
jgi:hypothetical protein